MLIRLLVFVLWGAMCDIIASWGTLFTVFLFFLFLSVIFLNTHSQQNSSGCQCWESRYGSVTKVLIHNPNISTNVAQTATHKSKAKHDKETYFYPQMNLIYPDTKKCLSFELLYRKVTDITQHHFEIATMSIIKKGVKCQMGLLWVS